MRTPEIILKLAQSQDGKVNEGPNKRTAISGLEAQIWTHDLRSQVDAVCIGAETLRIDNPDLSPYLIPGSPCPNVIVVTRRGPLPRLAKFFSNPERKCWILSQEPVSSTSTAENRVLGKENFLHAFLDFTGKEGYKKILIEGGPRWMGQWLTSPYWSVFHLITSPLQLPQGESWKATIPENWEKGVRIGNFIPLGNDRRVEIRPKP